MKRLFLVFALAVSLAAPMAVQAATPEMVQEKCPVMGYKPNPELYTDYKGKRIYFCCPACPEEFKKNPEKYMEKLEKEGIQLQDAPKAEQ